MKLKPRNTAESIARPPAGGGTAAAGWATTNVEAFRRLADNEGQSKRIPEFWMPPTGKATLSLLDDDAVVSYMAYRVNEGGRRFNWYIAPPPGSQDLFNTELGLRAQRRFVFRVIHHEGYVAKATGKAVTNIPRFWIVGGRIYTQIKAAEEMAEATLTERTLSVMRKGTGQSTVYTIIPVPRKAIAQQTISEANKLLVWSRWFKPLDAKAQRALVNTLAASAPPEEDDDDAGSSRHYSDEG